MKMEMRNGFIFLLLLLLVNNTGSFGTTFLPRKTFDVFKYGAIADGRTDSSKVFMEAWRDACAYDGVARVLVRQGRYLIKTVSFVGPCRASSITFTIQGILRAPTSDFFTDTWIAFRYLNNLVLQGGTFDGRGNVAWPYNDCKSNSNCQKLPATLRFDFVNNSRVERVLSINSKNVHINLFACNNVDLSHILISAPASSPNTDGIHIGNSKNIRISRSTISTGDDCIAMVSGSESIDIFGVACGPGHGISIGSLGRGPQNEYVKNIAVRNCRFIGTDNGVRIKTWAQSSSYSLAENILFENIVMQNSKNPIVIDQRYCPYETCAKGESDSDVQITDVTFRNIWGTSGSKVAVNLQCSGVVPCRNVKLVDINLGYSGHGGSAVSQCSNVIGSVAGSVVPSGCI